MYCPRASAIPVFMAAACRLLTSCLIERTRGVVQVGYHVLGVVGGAVVHDYDFVVGEGLGQDAVDRAGQHIGAVVGGDYDADFGVHGRLCSQLWRVSCTMDRNLLALSRQLSSRSTLSLPFLPIRWASSGFSNNRSIEPAVSSISLGFADQKAGFSVQNRFGYAANVGADDGLAESVRFQKDYSKRLDSLAPGRCKLVIAKTSQRS